MIEYETPEILQDSDEDVIHERMLSNLPSNIDTSEGSVVWDLTRPTAIEVARFKGWDMDYAIQMIFPQFSTGEVLDYHGEARGIHRKEAIAATGVLTITGEIGTTITKGDLFATESVNDQESISYAADETYVIPSSGTININVTCTEAGIVGNTVANTIILVETTNDDISTVTNSSAVTGGVDTEEDDDYRERILEYDQAKDVSYVGSVSDYKRWANEVSGVGGVVVIPAQDNSGTVTLVITDGNGDPAGQALCTAVYNHIMQPNDPINRLTAPNVILVVQAPASLTINITATVELSGTTTEEVTAEFTAALRDYMRIAIDDGEIRYTKVCNILGDITGVYDFSNLLINNAATNISVSSQQIPVINTITLTSGVV